jgi:hypothetical protein
MINSTLALPSEIVLRLKMFLLLQSMYVQATPDTSYLDLPLAPQFLFKATSKSWYPDSKGDITCHIL